MRIDLIAFDADDTLWHTEHLYVEVQQRFTDLLAPYGVDGPVDQRLLEIETRNVALYGYGIKGFALSLIEAAVDLTQGRISGRDVQQVIAWARDMMTADVELLDGAAPAVAELAGRFPLMIITKGDLFDQQSKVARSGLRPHFRRVEILSDKTPASYAALLMEHRVEPANFIMVGNSLRSDILPVLALGGAAVHVPYPLTWAHEHGEPPPDAAGGFHELERISDLPALIDRLSG
jgi:putative hydrolase of the HAD superfamily